jgi:cell wall-associated NlpC family hydrolase
MNISLKTTPRSLISILVLLPVLTIMLLLVSCTANKKHTTTGSHVAQQAVGNSNSDDIENSLLEEYRQWQGTRYRMGGNDGNGIDCSGFVQKVYLDAFNIKLPRTTIEQVKQGNLVAFHELKPGDLVFFRLPSYPRHVGIFFRDSKFIHASKSNGVMISKIDATYWDKYFLTARRILPASGSQ